MQSFASITARPIDAKPYKGAESYQLEDAHLFFGRDHSTAQIVACILSSRLSVLHAASGTGKTSLLNAKVVPLLETRGWRCVTVRPQNQPIQAIQRGSLQQLLPPLEFEAAAIRRLLTLAPELGPATLAQAQAYFQGLPKASEWRRRLLAPFRQHGDTAGVWSVPMFCYLLHGSHTPQRFLRHVQALLTEPNAPTCTVVDDAVAVLDLLSILGSERAQAAYQDWMADVDLPVYGLLPFFRNLFEMWGAGQPDYGVVLIIDQFEELFTLFADRGPLVAANREEGPDWRLREALFGEMRALLSYGTADGDIGQWPLPLRIVLSMRNEYVAQLDAIRAFAGPLERSSHHLGPLLREDAEAVIRQPAKDFGYDYSDECFRRIVDDLTREGRYIEPSQVQIVCEKLWDHTGRQLALLQEDGGHPQQLPTISYKTFEVTLGGTATILANHLKDTLSAFSPDEQEEIIEILEPLITPQGTRNIVEQSQLIAPPFRHQDLRLRLLEQLKKRNIIRIEPRLGGYFAEITHEFLIHPILDRIKESTLENPGSYRFRSALRWLTRMRDSNRSQVIADVPLGEGGFDILHEFRERVVWDAWAASVMFRSALEWKKDRDTLGEWLERFDRLSVRAVG